MDELKAYLKIKGVPNEALVKMAKFGTVVDQWMEDEGLVSPSNHVGKREILVPEQ